MSYRCLLLDIEGTTTPISFVHDVLFPYVANHLDSFLDKRFEEAAVQDCIDEIRRQADSDLAQKDSQGAVIVPSNRRETIISAVAVNVRQAMKRDRKLTGLKQLQGLIWADGYESGQLKSIVYDDVVAAFKRWQDYTIAIYSSGSIQAQKLLFRYTEHGDLTHHLSDYFDTTSGSKIEQASYHTIAAKLQLDPHQIFFLTDNVKEAQAAKLAGLACLLLDRPGNAPFTAEHADIASIIKTFDQVDEYLGK